MDWSLGFPNALLHRIYAQNKLSFLPLGINGITQNYSPSGKWITNINLFGPLLDNADEQGIYWLSLDEAFRNADNFRTPDTLVLLEKIHQRGTFGLDFIKLTCPLKSPTNQPYHTEPTDHHVASTVARFPEGPFPRYALAELGEGEREEVRGKLSLIGGHLIPGEQIAAAADREELEEVSIQIGRQLGLVGAFVGASSRGHYIVNTVSAVHGLTRPASQLDRRGEVARVKFLTPNEIYTIPKSQFRSPDTRAAVLLTDYMITHGRNLIPHSAIETIQNAAWNSQIFK